MNFGMLHLFENPVGKSEHEIVREQLTLMRAAEDYGFDSVWPAEHHFSEYGYCASPALTLAALALETKRLRLGTGVVVLPLNHPLRVAEDYAMLDLMSDGRVDLGVGRGYQPTEFAGYAIDPTTTRAMFDEGIEVIRQAWTRDAVTFHGNHYRFDGVPVRPKPLQRPHPPIWMAALSPDTFELAGRYGFHLLFGTAFGLPPEKARELQVAYRRGLVAGGHDLLVCLGVWRHAVRRLRVVYEPAYWSLVFPIGMYTASTWQLERVLETGMLAWIPRYVVYVALAAWTAAFVGLLRRLVQAATVRALATGTR